MSFQPTDIAGCKLWLKADSLSLNDGDAVGTWADQSGNGNDATQATGSKKPLYKVNILNGKPVIRFDGTDDRLGGAFSLSTGEASTHFIVHRLSSGNSTSRILEISDGPTQTKYRNSSWVNSTHNLSAYDSVNLYSSSTARSLGAFLIETLIFATNAGAFYASGALDKSMNPCVQAAVSNYYLGDGPNGGIPLNGDIAEVLVYNSALSAANRQNVEAYLSAKYNIGISANWSWTVTDAAPNAEGSFGIALSMSENAPSSESISLSATISNVESAPSGESLSLAAAMNAADPSPSSEALSLAVSITQSEPAPAAESLLLGVAHAIAESSFVESLSFSLTVAAEIDEAAPAPESLFVSVSASVAEASFDSESFTAEGVGAVLFFNEAAPAGESFSLAAFLAAIESPPSPESLGLIKWSPEFTARVAKENRAAIVPFEDRRPIVASENRRAKA